MKFNKILASVLAVSGICTLASCSSDEPNLSPDNENNNGSAAAAGADSYIHVRLANLPDGSRATVEETGSAAERKINDISFFFFYEDGSPFKMQNNNINGELTLNNMVTPKLNLSSTTGHIAATLVLGKTDPTQIGWKGNVPAKLIAVANLGEGNYTNLANKTISELQLELVEAKSIAPASGEFRMTSPSYLDATNKLKCWADIALENIKTKPEDAIGSPVTVYLERLAAKVAVVHSPTAETDINGRYLVAKRNITDANGDQKEIKLYANILGWDLNATVQKSNLLKDINFSTSPFAGWNSSSAMRSFWAATPSLAEPLKTDFTWGDLGNEFGIAHPEYCYENTLQASVGKVQDAKSKATKVLLKAQIVDENNNAQDMVSWAGVLYKTSDFKKMVAKHVADDEGSVANVTFKRETQGKKHVVSTYYNGVKIPLFDNIRVWDNGVCYYIVNIRHTVDQNNAPVYGVVRNHFYKVSIKSIAGLGTPGGTGDHDNPENPDPELESFVAAEVDVLNWHVVSFDVDVES